MKRDTAELSVDTRVEDSPPHRKNRKIRALIATAVPGAAAGALCAWLFAELTFCERSASYIILGAALVFGWLSTTGARGVVTAAGAVSILSLLVIGFTPLVPWLLDEPPQADALERCDAVVSLGAGINDDRTLSANTQDRAIYSLTLLRAGYAPVLVLTGNENQGESVIRDRMHALGLDFAMENCGPVHDTHDESVAVAKLFKAHGWRRVILVTHDWHMRRAAAAFEKAGVHVLRSTCPDTRGDMHHPRRLHDRIRALACLIHEKLGYCVYRMHGWL